MGNRLAHRHRRSRDRRLGSAGAYAGCPGPLRCSLFPELGHPRRSSSPAAKIIVYHPAISVMNRFISGTMSRLAHSAVLLLLALATALGYAQGGPPMRTDDPGTPGNGNFEINLALTSDRRVDERVFEAPLLDINYGVGERIQLKFELPFVVRGTNDGPTKSGLGNSDFGIKWRFYENKKLGLDISTYPQLEFNNPTQSATRGLADQGVRMLLPLESTKKIGALDVDAEIGFALRQHGANDWIAGLALGRSVTPRWELVGEFNAAARTDGTDRETTLDAGTRYRLFRPVVLLLMVGHTVRLGDPNEPRFIGYGGLQFQFSTRKHPEPSAP